MAAAPTIRVSVLSLLSWLLSFTEVSGEDVCSYTTYAFNEYDRRNELMVSYKACPWGCCWKYSDPCCSPPVGLIVGCVVGGFLCLVVLVVGLCCCYCFCCRREGGGRAGGGMAVRYPHPHPGAGSVHLPSAVIPSPGMGERESTLSTSLPPGVYQPPPSYEEVMAGQINAAFKPDADPPPP